MVRKTIRSTFQRLKKEEIFETNIQKIQVGQEMKLIEIYF